jgi:hypothetical protein
MSHLRVSHKFIHSHTRRTLTNSHKHTHSYTHTHIHTFTQSYRKTLKKDIGKEQNSKTIMEVRWQVTQIHTLSRMSIIHMSHTHEHSQIFIHTLAQVTHSPTRHINSRTLTHILTLTFPLTYLCTHKHTHIPNKDLVYLSETGDCVWRVCQTRSDVCVSVWLCVTRTWAHVIVCDICISGKRIAEQHSPTKWYLRCYGLKLHRPFEFPGSVSRLSALRTVGCGRIKHTHKSHLHESHTLTLTRTQNTNAAHVKHLRSGWMWITATYSSGNRI